MFLYPELNTPLYFHMMNNVFIVYPYRAWTMFMWSYHIYSYCMGYFEYYYPIYSLHYVKSYNLRLGTFYRGYDHEWADFIITTWKEVQTFIGLYRLFVMFAVPAPFFAWILFVHSFVECEF